ncbi:hypothetical protein G6F23_015421 [Rhizopus arrhizus]|nr:hypothetical protein G6F23_015421 [Rhizopus arrhizus]
MPQIPNATASRPWDCITGATNARPAAIIDENSAVAPSGLRSTMRPPKVLPIRPTPPKAIMVQPTICPLKPASRSSMSAR